MEGRDRLINFRSFFVVGLFVTAAVFCAYLYSFSFAAGISLISILLCATATLCVVFFFRQKRNKSPLHVFIAFCISFILSVSAFAIGACYIDERVSDSENYGFHSVSGRVCAFDTGSVDKRVHLEDLTFDGRSVNGKLRITLSGTGSDLSEIIDIGDVLRFGTYITAPDFIMDGSVNGYSFRTDIRYYSSSPLENFEAEFGSATPIESFLSVLRKHLTKNMGDRYGNIAFSMLTGDKYGLDDDIIDMYSLSGIGHIMAVSGLHIGFFVVLLNFIFAKLGKKIKFGIISAILIVYIVLADFSPSVIRAVIMSIAGMFSVFVGGRRDILSSLFFAYSLILAVRPFYLFESGFLLSFGSIYGIALFAGSLRRFFMRRGANRKIAEAIGTSLSVQSGIFPTQIYFFKKFSLLAVIVNMFVIPYISVLFIVLIVCTAIGAIPGLGAILKLSEWLMIPVDYIAYGISSIPWQTLRIYPTCACFVAYPVMFIASEFFMAPKGKLPIMLSAFFVAFVLCIVPVYYPEHYIAAPMGSEPVSIVRDGDEYYVIGYIGNGRSLVRELESLAVDRVDGIFPFAAENVDPAAMLYVANNIEVESVYFHEFDYTAKYLIDNGVNVRLISAETDVPVHEFYCDERVAGYSYGGTLFLDNRADASRDYGFEIVRAKTVESQSDSVIYLCNRFDGVSDNVFHNGNGSYIYVLGD